MQTTPDPADTLRQERYYASQTELRLALYDILTTVERHGTVAAGGGYNQGFVQDLEVWLRAAWQLRLEVGIATPPAEEAR